MIYFFEIAIIYLRNVSMRYLSLDFHEVNYHTSGIINVSNPRTSSLNPPLSYPSPATSYVTHIHMPVRLLVRRTTHTWLNLSPFLVGSCGRSLLDRVNFRFSFDMIFQSRLGIRSRRIKYVSSCDGGTEISTCVNKA